MSNATGEMALEGKVRAPASAYRDSIMFRTNPDQEGLGTREVLLRLDEEAADHAQSKRELYWAGVLGETVAITVKTDPEHPERPLLNEHQHMLLLLEMVRWCWLFSISFLPIETGSNNYVMTTVRTYSNTTGCAYVDYDRMLHEDNW